MRVCEAVAVAALAVMVLVVLAGCDDIKDPEPRTTGFTEEWSCG